MMTAAECRIKADEATRMADVTNDEKLSAQWLTLAKEWLAAAAVARAHEALAESMTKRASD